MKKRLIALLLALCIAVGTGVFAVPAVAEAIKVYVSANTLPVYSRANTQSSRMGTMSFGESMTCVAVNKDWACVKNTSGAVGYCKTAGLTNINPNKYSVPVYAAADGVKVYAKPDTSSAVLKVLKLNDSFTGVAVTSDGKWFRLKNGSTYGYVLSSTMAAEPKQVHGALVSSEVYIISNTLPVYASANNASKQLGTMAYGESMGLMEVSGAWAKVMNDKGAIGYCAAEGISAENPNVLNLEVFAAESGVKVYSKPNASTAVVKNAALNEKFIAVSITLDGEWLRVKSGSGYGYIKAEDVVTSDFSDPETIVVYVIDNTMPVYEGMDSASAELGMMALGESLELLGVDGEWAQVRNEAGEIGYCSASALSDQNPNILNLKVYITEDGVGICKKPDASYGVLKTAAKNEAYTAVAVTLDGLWMRVVCGSGYGYVPTEYLSGTEINENAGMMVYVSANTLTVYKEANVNSKALGTMAYGESLLLRDKSGAWAKVENASGAIGYCDVSGLTADDPNNINRMGYASDKGIKVYKKPAVSSGVLKTLNKNEEVMVVAVTKDMQWMRIITGGSYGYVQAQYIVEAPASEFEPAAVYVSANTLKVYKAESESSALLGTMSFGEKMTLLNVNDGWALVQNASGAKGYCSYGGLTASNPNILNDTMYAQENITLYKKPLTASGAAKSVKMNTALTVVAITEDGVWARVNTGSGSYAYVEVTKLASSKVEAEDSFADESFTKKTVYGIATSTTCYASPTTSSKSVGSLYFGQSATCTGINGDWMRVVNASGTVAYCKAGNVSTENPNKYSVAVYAKNAGTKVYQKPSTSSAVISTVGKNGKCTAVAVSQDSKWYRLKNGSSYGYVLASDFATSVSNTENVASAKIKKVISIAEDQYGKKYVYGAEGPERFDCSGLIIYAFKHGAGISTFPRTAEKMGYSNTYPKVSKISDLKVGDLVFFDTSSDSDLCDHVGIYLGNGNFVHASSAAAKVVKSNLNSGYYNRVFSWGRRVL